MKIFRTKLLLGIAVAGVGVLLGQQGKSKLRKLTVAPDLDRRLARWRSVKMPIDKSGLTPAELKMIDKLADACHYLDEIFWLQSDPEGLTLYKSLAKSGRDQKLQHLLLINGGRFDLIDENKPFVGPQPMPPGRGLYPENVTRAELDAYIQRHPEKKAEIYNPYTVIRRERDGFSGVPYHVAYREWLEPAAASLRDAASFSDDPKFADFLRARAAALLSDDYYASDLKWMDLEDPKIDLIYAPYETYLDGVLGVKGSYGASILIRNQAESQKLAVFQKYVADIQDALPLAPVDRPSKRGLRTPMEVMDAPLRAGDLRHGYQAVADNLPNDPRIHEKKGSKKIFFRNFMDSRVNEIILPLAQRVMRPDQAARASAEGYLAMVMMHEISHGLGPAYACVGGKQVDIREAIGPVFPGLEEAKADVAGMVALKWLVDHGVLPKARLEEYYASYVAGIFRTVRFGTGEAHGQAEMMEFNYLARQHAIVRENSGRYSVDYGRIPGALADLAKELLEIEATGDRSRAEKWFAKYDAMPAELKTSLDAASDLPVDIDPVFSFRE
jgi:hypothetical protein